MPKITMIGAGSVFAGTLLKDIMLIDGLDGGEIILVDTDAKRLGLSEKFIKAIAARIAEKTPGKWTIKASPHRRRVMRGSDYIINSIEVAGTSTVRCDYEVPLRYGVDQCIGDTIGPGGIFKALRTIPVWLDILADVEKYCPGALVLNYTNPMSMMMLAAARSGFTNTLGLCHSVQNNARRLAEWCGVPADELAYRCGGINHLAWYMALSHNGKDLYPTLFKRARTNKKLYKKEPVRFDIMFNFGFFPTESSGHFSEYVPYYRKRKDLLRKFTKTGSFAGSGITAYEWPKSRKENDANRRKALQEVASIELTRSGEFAADIIEAREGNARKRIHASVPNGGLIPNLPATGVVEVPVMIDKHEVSPCRFGKLPPQLAALCASNMAVFDCAVDGILNKDKEAIHHAMMLDPLTAAVCSPGEIRKMTNEMARKQKRHIPPFMGA